jgi:hypothetical protein
LARSCYLSLDDEKPDAISHEQARACKLWLVFWSGSVASAVKNPSLSARRTPSDKSAGYVTAPAEAGFTAQKPTRSDGLYRALLRSTAQVKLLTAEPANPCADTFSVVSVDMAGCDEVVLKKPYYLIDSITASQHDSITA